MSKKEIEIPAGKTAEWKEVNGQQVLVLVDKKKEEKRPITERVKTFEDACRELGEKHPFVILWGGICKSVSGEFVKSADMADVIAYYKLRIITAALNEGWEPQFTRNECRWYSWSFLWAKAELSEKSDKWQQEHDLKDLANYRGEWEVFASAASARTPTNANAGISSRLCYKSEELARYSGMQFTDLWADFYLIRK